MAEKKVDAKDKPKDVKAVPKSEKKREKRIAEKREIPKAMKLFTIPLKKAYEKTRKIRVPYSVRLIRKFLETHLKTDDIRIGRKLNEKLWEKSIQHPPRKIKVGVFPRGTGFDVELEGFIYEDFKPLSAKKPEGLAEKLTSRLGGKALKNQEEENLADGKVEENPEEKTNK